MCDKNSKNAFKLVKVIYGRGPFSAHGVVLRYSVRINNLNTLILKILFKILNTKFGILRYSLNTTFWSN